MGHKAAGLPEEFAKAVNDEIKAEMARSQVYDSNRKLAAALQVSGDYVNRRIGNRTPWDLHDLELLGTLFGLHPEVFVERAVRTLTERGIRFDDFAARRIEQSVPGRSLRSVAKKRKNKVEDGGEQ